MSIRKLLFSLFIVTASASTVAAPEKFTIDTNHTYPGLEFPYMGLSVWRGKFNKTTGIHLRIQVEALKDS